MTPSPAAEQSTPDSNESSACSGCPDAHKCRTAWSAPRRGPFSPAGLSISSAAVFLLPLIGAIIAGAWAHACKSDSAYLFWDIAAAAVGFIAGAVVALITMPLIKKHFGYQRPWRS